MSATQLVGGVTCPPDDEMNEIILATLGWKKSEEDDFGAAGMGWHRPDPARTDGLYIRSVRECDRPNFTHRQTGPWHVQEWARELLKTDQQRQTFILHLNDCVMHGQKRISYPWILLMASPREWAACILMAIKPELFDFWKPEPADSLTRGTDIFRNRPCRRPRPIIVEPSGVQPLVFHEPVGPIAGEIDSPPIKMDDAGTRGRLRKERSTLSLKKSPKP